MNIQPAFLGKLTQFHPNLYFLTKIADIRYTNPFKDRPNLMEVYHEQINKGDSTFYKSFI